MAWPLAAKGIEALIRAGGPALGAYWGAERVRDGISAPEAGESGYRPSEASRTESLPVSASDFLPKTEYPAEPIEAPPYDSPFPTEELNDFTSPFPTAPETTWQDTLMRAEAPWGSRTKLADVPPDIAEGAAEIAKSRAKTLEQWLAEQEVRYEEFDPNVNNMRKAYEELQEDLEDVQRAAENLQWGDLPDYVTLRQERSPHPVVRVSNYVGLEGNSYFGTGTLRASGGDSPESLFNSYQEKILMVPTEEPFEVRRSWLVNPGNRLPPAPKHFRGEYSNQIGFYQTTVRNFEQLDAPSSHLESIQSDIYPLTKGKSRMEQAKREELNKAERAEFPLLKDDQWIENIVQRHVADSVNTNKLLITMNSGAAARDVNAKMPMELAKGIYDKKAKGYLQKLADQYSGSFSTIQAPTGLMTREEKDIYVLDLRGANLDSLKREGFGYACGGLVSKDLSAADFLPNKP